MTAPLAPDSFPANGVTVLHCAECGRADDGERGWTLRLDYDDELHAFCPRL
jgi:hypothetical protein